MRHLGLPPALSRLGATPSAAIRLWNGRPAPRTTELRELPQLELFEYEASPWCRRVRETLCVLGLPALIRPCPRETLRVEGAFSSLARHKPDVKGRLIFPYLVDHTADMALNESRDIVEHLWNRYGEGVERPRADALLNGGTLPRLVDFALLAGPSGLRPWASCGLTVAPSSSPAEPLVLHANEPDPGSRLVREMLCSLQIAYRHVPSDAPNVPHLEDPNTGFATFGAGHACRHVAETYAQGSPLSHLAPVPEPNLGDARRSWMSPLFTFL